MLKVVKFGGSSLASAEQFKKVADIIHADESRRYVVPSAPGKRFKEDVKVTDMLYGCYALAEEEKDFSTELKLIEDRYQEIIDGLSLKLSLEEQFQEIEKNFRDKAGSNYAAGLATLEVSTPSLLPWPPANNMAIISFLIMSSPQSSLLPFTVQ